MPEYREVLACVILILNWFKIVQDAGLPLVLQAIWVDATKAEQKAAMSGSRARLGHVYRLSSSQKCPRGSKGAQQQVYPPQPWAGTDTPEPLTSLVLQDVQATPRTVVLNMKTLFLQVRYSISL